MWSEIVAHLGKFPSAVLTGIDTNGYPISIRCTPQPDNERQVLRLSIPAHLPFQSGAAGLLCHYHNDQLWDLKALHISGSLSQTEQGWTLTPANFVVSGSLGGTLGQIQWLFKARATAKKYLQKRGLSRPKIAWHEFNELKNEI